MPPGREQLAFADHDQQVDRSVEPFDDRAGAGPDQLLGLAAGHALQPADKGHPPAGKPLLGRSFVRRVSDGVVIGGSRFHWRVMRGVADGRARFSLPGRPRGVNQPICLAHRPAESARIRPVLSGPQISGQRNRESMTNHGKDHHMAAPTRARAPRRVATRSITAASRGIGIAIGGCGSASC